jgi:hypothetical protein
MEFGLIEVICGDKRAEAYCDDWIVGDLTAIMVTVERSVKDQSKLFMSNRPYMSAWIRSGNSPYFAHLHSSFQLAFGIETIAVVLSIVVISSYNARIILSSEPHLSSNQVD